MADEGPKVVPLQQAWRRFLVRGSRLLQEGDFGRAAEAFARSLEQAPDEPQVLLALGRERLRQGRFDEAEPLLRRAHARDPRSPAAAALLARLLGLHQRRLEEAFEVVHHALADCADPAPLQVIRGELLLEQGAWKEARAAFAQALQDPRSDEAARVGLARAFNLEGIALGESGEPEPALFAFKRAADLDPAWSGPHVNMGVVLGRLGRQQKAALAYQAALARDPDNPVAYFNLGTALHELGRHAEAVRTFEELILLAPDYPHVRGALANVLGELRELDRAIALFLEELEVDERCASCWSGLGLAYVCSGNATRGERCLLRALEVDPGYFNALHNLAALYAAQGRVEAAQAMLKRAHGIDPERTSSLLASDERLAGLDARDERAPTRS